MEDIARLLLLVHALAYETDATVRENFLIQSHERLAAYLPGVDEATDKALRRQFDALKKGGAG